MPPLPAAGRPGSSDHARGGSRLSHLDLSNRPVAGSIAALAASLAAFALREMLAGSIGSGFVYITFYPAVMLAATLGGWFPGVLATVISSLLAMAWLLPPRGQAGFSVSDGISLAVFAGLGLFMSVLAGLYQAARRRAADYEKQIAVREGDERLRAFFGNTVVGAIQFDLDGRFIETNDRFNDLIGYAGPDLRRMKVFDLFCGEACTATAGPRAGDGSARAAGDGRERPGAEADLLGTEADRPGTGADRPGAEADLLGAAREGMAALGKLMNVELPACDVETCFRRSDGSSIWLRLSARLVRDAHGRPARVAGIVEDVSATRRARAERETTIEFLRLVNQAEGTDELLRAASTFFRRLSGCEAFAIRLRDGDDYPYFEADGFPAEFIEMENHLCARDQDGRICCDSSGRPVLECLCGRVIRGRSDSEKPFYTAGGSFWTNSTSEWAAAATPEDRGVNQRNRCNREGYESVALVPLEIGAERLGLLQVNDPRRGMFSAEAIALWERLAGYLAVAVAKSRAEKALRDSEARYRSLVENSPDAILVHREGRILYANPAAVRLYGARDAARIVGTNALDYVHPDDRAGIARRIKLVAGGEHVPLVESRQIRLDGRQVTVETTAGPVIFGGDPATQVVLHDVSERKLAEVMNGALNSINQVIHSAHDVNEMMQRAVSEAARATASDTAAISLRRNGRWVVSYVHGLPSEIVGTEMSDEEEPHALIAIETKRPVAINDALTDERVNREHMKSWGVRSVLVVPLVARDEAIGVLFLNHHEAGPGYSRAHVDFAVKLGSAVSLAVENARLFENLRAEVKDRTVREERISVIARLYSVLSRVNEAIVRTRDEQTLYEEVCRIVAGAGGFPLVWIGQVRGREIAVVASGGRARDYLRDVRLEIDGPLGNGPTGTCLRENRSVTNDDFDRNPATLPWREKAREYGFRASAAFPLRRENQAIGVLTLYASHPGAFDAEHVNLLESLSADVSWALEAMDQERRRAEMERALRESERELREVDRHKNEFMAALSHELRNPLAPIKNSLYVLQHVDPAGEQGERARAVIERQVGQLAHLVDDLLDVTRIRRNKVELQKRRLELNELVQRTIEDHASLFEQSRVRLEIHPAPRPVFVDADWNRLAQVVGNLLQNAGKFTLPDGCVSVSVTADTAANRAVIKVADTGIGMAPEMIGRLFQPFMQADSGLDRSKGGLGLGLALVKGLMELHGGEVRAESAGLGRGSEFIVSLPLGSQEGGRSEPAPAPRRARRRVLIIEDNVDAADSLCEALEVVGHDVAVAYTGPEGLARAREFKCEVVLCDIGLPGMSGYDVARRIRDDAELKDVLLVALSGYARPEDLEKAAEAGFHCHLAKPPRLEVLQRLLADPPGSFTSRPSVR